LDCIAVCSLKEYLYQITRDRGKRTHSSATYANAWHHRSDAFSSVAVVIGAIAMKFGYPMAISWCDCRGMMIVMVGIKIVGDCISEFAKGRWIIQRWSRFKQ
jgi:divalent metal cation (Fe/Co/Zn/Cd) transporter